MSELTVHPVQCVEPMLGFATEVVGHDTRDVLRHRHCDAAGWRDADTVRAAVKVERNEVDQ